MFQSYLNELEILLMIQILLLGGLVFCSSVHLVFFLVEKVLYWRKQAQKKV